MLDAGADNNKSEARGKGLMEDVGRRCSRIEVSSRMQPQVNLITCLLDQGNRMGKGHDLFCIVGMHHWCVVDRRKCELMEEGVYNIMWGRDCLL
jgi:hypothetical protein